MCWVFVLGLCVTTKCGVFSGDQEAVLEEIMVRLHIPIGVFDSIFEHFKEDCRELFTHL